MWFMSHRKKGKERNTRAFREYDNPLWKATGSGGNSKASLSQVVFFHSQLVHSFRWPISLVPSLLRFLGVLTLCWLPGAFVEADGGFLFSWLISATGSLGAARWLSASVWRTHTTSTTGTFFCRQKFRTWPHPVLSILPDLQRAFGSSQEKGYMFLTGSLEVNCRKRVDLRAQRLLKEDNCFLMGDLTKNHQFPRRRMNTPFTLLWT